jgi:surfactin family lipopeptide synthetase A
VVVVHQHETENKRLVAYITRANGLPASDQELRRFMEERLPEYMVPNIFMRLEQLPLTPNGKIDRNALPRELHIESVEHMFVAPRTRTEEVLCEIWMEVLGLTRIGIHDNFFRLGGHSLSAIKVLARIEEQWHTQLSLRSLFEESTIAEVAKSIDARGAATETPIKQIRRGKKKLTSLLAKVSDISDKQMTQYVESEPDKTH